MVVAMAAWDGWGSTVLGSMLGGIFAGIVVVIGARMTIAHERKVRQEDEAERAATRRPTATSSSSSSTSRATDGGFDW